jgi:hypothetical protein
VKSLPMNEVEGMFRRFRLPFGDCSSWRGRNYKTQRKKSLNERRRWRDRILTNYTIEHRMLIDVPQLRTNEDRNSFIRKTDHFNEFGGATRTSTDTRALNPSNRYKTRCRLGAELWVRWELKSRLAWTEKNCSAWTTC